MTGRVLTQPELCELPPSVLLLLPPLPRPRPLLPTHLLTRGPLLLAQSSLSLSAAAAAAAAVAALLVSPLSPKRDPFRYTYPTRYDDAHASNSHGDVFLFFLLLPLLLLFSSFRPKGRENKEIARATIESVHFQSTHTHTRGALHTRIGIL